MLPSLILPVTLTVPPIRRLLSLSCCKSRFYQRAAPVEHTTYYQTQHLISSVYSGLARRGLRDPGRYALDALCVYGADAGSFARILCDWRPFLAAGCGDFLERRRAREFFEGGG